MNRSSQMVRATHLFYHLDDLRGLGKLTPQDCQVLQAALDALLSSSHPTACPEPAVLPAGLPAHSYVLLVREGTPHRLLVRAAGQKDRFLRHVPIFCPWGFATEGYAARDTALAILADFWGERLSRRSFASGLARSCRDYLAVAELVSSKLRRGGILTTAELAAFLQWGRSNPPIPDYERCRENRARGKTHVSSVLSPPIQQQGEQKHEGADNLPSLSPPTQPASTR